MLNKYTKDGLKLLQNVWPQSHAVPISNGSAVVFVPSMKLPEGFAETICTVFFVAPVGFPFIPPTDFYTDIDVHLRSGTRPNSAIFGLHQELRDLPQWMQSMYWRLQLQAWTPSRDTLLTYARVIQSRLPAYAQTPTKVT